MQAQHANALQYQLFAQQQQAQAQAQAQAQQQAQLQAAQYGLGGGM